MFNLIKSPIENDTLSAWAKITDDIAKIAFLAIPAIIYGEYSILFKTMNVIALSIGSYLFLLVGRMLRQQNGGSQ